MAEQALSAWLAWLWLGSTCILGSTARAEFSTEPLSFAKGLSVELLQGYPQGSRLSVPATVGFSIHNRGPDRSLHFELEADSRTERILHVPHDEARRLFVSLPQRTGPGDIAYRIHDSETGTVRAGVAGASFTTGHTVARLGPIATGFNVEDPWTLLGDVGGAHMPDDWRGLSGLWMIVAEASQADSALAGQPALRDWLVMGGLLVVSTPRQAFPALSARTDLVLPSPLVGIAGGAVQSIGLGAVAYVAPEELEVVGPRFLEDTGIAAHLTRSFEGGVDYNEHAEIAYQRLPGVGARPSLVLFLVLFGYALLVGPIGWRMLVTRRGRPLAYVGLVLVSAALFSSGVLVADTLAQGIDPKGVSTSLRLIDGRANRELGIEELVVYPTTSRGTTLRARSHVGFVLPPITAMDYQSKRFLWTLHRDVQELAGALDPRVRRLVAGQHVGKARHRLEIERLAPDGLRVENHLDADIARMTLVLEGRCYVLGAVERGGSGRASPVTPCPERAIELPLGSHMRPFSALLLAIERGDRGPNRYYGVLRRRAGESRLLARDLREIVPSTHYIAGVLP